MSVPDDIVATVIDELSDAVKSITIANGYHFDLDTNFVYDFSTASPEYLDEVDYPLVSLTVGPLRVGRMNKAEDELYLDVAVTGFMRRDEEYSTTRLEMIEKANFAADIRESITKYFDNQSSGTATIDCTIDGDINQAWQQNGLLLIIHTTMSLRFFKVN